MGNLLPVGWFLSAFLIVDRAGHGTQTKHLIATREGRVPKQLARDERRDIANSRFGGPLLLRRS